MFKRALIWLVALLLMNLMFGWRQEFVLGQGDWATIAHVTSVVPARWTIVTTTPDLRLHAFWAAAEDDTKQGIYSASYYTIMHSESIDGITWTEPIDIIYDEQRLDVMKALATPSGLHLFWNSDCVRHAMVERGVDPNNAQTWMSSQKCVAPRSIPEGIAVTADDSGRIYLVYSTGDSLNLQTSFDNGLTWSAPTTISLAQESGSAAIVAYPAIAVFGEYVYVIWSASASAAQDYQGRGVFFARSQDGGRSWSSPVQLSDENSGQPTIAVTSQESVHALWNTRVGISRRIYRRSDDGGQNWHQETVLFDKDVYGYTAGLQGPPALLAGRNGELFALLGTNAGPRFREQIGGIWSELRPLGTSLEGETWVTGLVQVGNERLCAYWNAVGSPSMGFSIRCRGKLEAIATRNAVATEIQTFAQDAQSQPISKPTVVYSETTTSEAETSNQENTQSPVVSAQTDIIPLRNTVSTVQTILISVLFSLIVILVGVLIQRERS
jgi:hypothetical protein